jgi:hypothetical protein
MGLTGFWMKPFPNNFTIPNNNSTDEGIGCRASSGAAGKGDAPLHHPLLEWRTNR